MRWILSRQSQETLRRFVAPGALLGFDYDGTLAPIVDNPDQARIPPATVRLLRRLSGAHPCVVISGRSRAELRPRLEGTGIRRTIGNHGGEPWNGAPAARKLIAQWNAAIAKELLSIRGVRIENKGYSVNVHYRQCRSRATARAQILEAVTPLPGARLISGKLVVSVVPENAPNKGTALWAELARSGLRRALYIGDDATDEDVFALNEGPRLLTIRVGRSLTSRAAYFIRCQSEIDELLNTLLG